MHSFRSLLLAFALATACARTTATSAARAPTPADLAHARAELTSMFEEMAAAANAHDTDRHMAFYIRSPELLFVMNDEPINGYDALHAKQLQWWQNGKSDVAYSVVGAPDYRMVGPGLVMQTYFLSSKRAVAGVARESRFGITALWQKRAEGWRIIYAHESMVVH